MVPAKFGFSKEERLSGKKNIEELFTKGSSFRLKGFAVKYLIRKEESANKILVSVPKKNFKRAVDRNLLKRRIREAYRLNKQLLTEKDSKHYVIGFLYISKSILTFHQIQDQLISILNRLNESKAQPNEE